MTRPQPHVIGRRTIHDGWNRLEIVTVEETRPDGSTIRHDREVIDHGHAAVVLAYDPDREVALLVRQARTPLLVDGGDAYLLEACAGIIDPGETPEATARREAEEEMGLKLRALRPIGSVVPSAGTLTERMHLFLAEISRADRKGDGGGMEGEGETIEIVEIPLADLFAMAKRGEIADAKTLILVQRLMIERGGA